MPRLSPTPVPPARSARKKLVLGLLMALAVAFGAVYVITHHGRERTDDAQIDADQIAVPARVGGVVQAVRFQENQTVHAGDVLAELDPEPARVKLAEAEAQLEAAKADADSADADATLATVNAHGNKSVAEAVLAQAQSGKTASGEQIAEGEAQVEQARTRLAQAKLDLERGKTLEETGAMAKAQLDVLETAFESATAGLHQAEARLAALKSSVNAAESKILEASARLKQSDTVQALIAHAEAKARAAHAHVATAQAARDLAALQLAYTRIVAPEDGVVSKKTIAVGQMVNTGQPIVQLVPTGKLWVTANYKETQVRNMRVGQKVNIEVDAFPGIDVEGEVESFSAATGARFTLLPPDNASGNYTKVVQRLPVHVAIRKIPEGVTLRPGMSVETTVDTRS